MKPHAYYTRVKDQQYRAAGVLPFAIAPAGQVLILLGRERGWGPRSKVLRWKDFGGHREAIDEDAEATAAREFSEETLGLFGGVEVASCSIAASTSSMTDRLRSSGGVFRVESPLRNGGNYCMFVARVAYIDPLLFNLATQENAVTKGVDGAEKCGFAWVEAGRLLAAIEAEEAGSVEAAARKSLGKNCRESSTEGDVAMGDATSGFPEKRHQVPESRAEVGNDNIPELSNEGSSQGPPAFRRSVVAVMVKGPKPARSPRGGPPRRKSDHKLLLHSSFVCTLRRAQAGGLKEFLSEACRAGGLGRQVLAGGFADWERGGGVLRGKRKETGEQEEGRGRKRMSSECLVYWIMHAKKIGALEEGPDAQRGGDICGKGNEQAVPGLKGRKLAGGRQGRNCEVGETDGFGKSQEEIQAAKTLPESVGLSDIGNGLLIHDQLISGAKAARGDRGFLEGFPMEQRSTVAGAFHEAVRHGAGEPAAVVASVLARAASKVEQAWSACALPSPQQPQRDLVLEHLPPLLALERTNSTPPSISGGNKPELLAAPTNAPPVNTVNSLPTAGLVHTSDESKSSPALALVHTTEHLVLRSPPEIHKSGSGLVGARCMHLTIPAGSGASPFDMSTSVGSANRSDSPAECTVVQSQQRSRIETADCKVELAERTSGMDVSFWELCARRYALDSGNKDKDRESGPVGDDGLIKCAIVTPGAQAAAAAWGELERQLNKMPQEGALAYARFVIEWGSLGDAEKKRRRKRRRLALART